MLPGKSALTDTRIFEKRKSSLRHFLKNPRLAPAEIDKDDGRGDDVADRITVEQVRNSARGHEVDPDDAENADSKQIRNRAYHHVILCA